MAVNTLVVVTSVGGTGTQKSMKGTATKPLLSCEKGNGTLKC